MTSKDNVANLMRLGLVVVDWWWWLLLLFSNDRMLEDCQNFIEIDYGQPSKSLENILLLKWLFFVLIENSSEFVSFLLVRLIITT